MKHVVNDLHSRLNQVVVRSFSFCPQNDALDAILYLRALSGIIAGVTAGLLGLEGIYVFLG